MNYTKGEWEVNTVHGVRVQTQEKLVAYISDTDGEAEDIVNAYLIAAAPDMYEALKEICSHLSLECSMNYLYKHNLSLPLSKGQAALAKADKGE